MLGFIGEEFMVCFLLLDINFHLSLWPLEAVWPSLAHQVCCVCSRPYTDCGQLIKEASYRPHSPRVSITAAASFSSPSYIVPSLFPDPFSIFLLLIGPSNWPFSCLKAVFRHILPIVFFLCPKDCCFGLGLCFTFPLGALCHVWL